MTLSCRLAKLAGWQRTSLVTSTTLAVLAILLTFTSVYADFIGVCFLEVRAMVVETEVIRSCGHAPNHIADVVSHQQRASRAQCYAHGSSE
jgi:hypothetical protein